MSFDWCFLKVATRVPLTRLVQSSRLQMRRLMYPSYGTLRLNKISPLLWQGSLNWVPRQFYQTVCYHRLKLFSSFSFSLSLLLWNMLAVESFATKREWGWGWSEREQHGTESGIKSKSNSKRESERKRRRNNQERWCRERAFGGYLVIGFIIQVHDFNFPLFLSKAGGAAGEGW